MRHDIDRRSNARRTFVRKRVFNWQGQRFVYLGIEGEPGGPLERQSQGLFERAGAELATHGLALDRNVVRTRVFGRTREARDAASLVRGQAFTGQARAATSSYISPAHFASAADVALDLYAMAAPTTGVPRKVTEMEPLQPFIRHLVWGPLVFHAGMTNEHFPTLREQCAEILPRAGARLQENGCDWTNVVRISCFLHESQDADALLAHIAALAPVALDEAEIEFVEGYSRPGKLVEIEITARR
jgi:enamine deaminase RidA (YjgF/YER057c/UK114 family)